MSSTGVASSGSNSGDTHRFDTVVIGSGVGGLSAAAKLAHAGQSVLVVERDVRIGGRASTLEQDGFLLPQGGIALELGGPMEALFREVGARYDVLTPTPGVRIRISRTRAINTTSPIGRLLVDRIGLRLAAKLVMGWKPKPGEEPTLDALLSRVTRRKLPHRLARNFVAGGFGLNADEVAARPVLTYLTTKGAFRRYGFARRGTGSVLQELVAVVERSGGTVWLESEVVKIERDAGRAVAVQVRRGDAAPERIALDAVISNAGPAATVRLLGSDLPEEYLATIHARDRPTPMIVVDIASQHPLMEEAGVTTFATTDRLAAIGHLTASAPAVAPPGWRLYIAYAVPVPALGVYDEDVEIAKTMAELREQLHDFDRARVLRTRFISGDWPAQRAVPGLEMPPATPVPNVINVGDGARAYGDGGMQACAVSGVAAANELRAAAHT